MGRCRGEGRDGEALIGEKGIFGDDGQLAGVVAVLGFGINFVRETRERGTYNGGLEEGLVDDEHVPSGFLEDQRVGDNAIFGGDTSTHQSVHSGWLPVRSSRVLLDLTARTQHPPA